MMSQESQDFLKNLEEEFWREGTRFDADRMEELIGADFFEFGRSGHIYERNDIFSTEQKPIHATFPLDDFKVRRLDEQTAQVTYNSAVRCDGVIQHARRSSIWSRTTKGWTLRFHQATPYEPES